jgi:FMN phosphatase YigB (HAD superfamily)
MTLEALIFDVDGTLAETEELHRAAFNDAFAAAGLNWHWDQSLYARLLAVTGGKERVKHYLDTSGAAPRLDTAAIAEAWHCGPACGVCCTRPSRPACGWRSPPPPACRMSKRCWRRVRRCPAST